jgi:hypothetical protein
LILFNFFSFRSKKRVLAFNAATNHAMPRIMPTVVALTDRLSSSWTSPRAKEAPKCFPSVFFLFSSSLYCLIRFFFGLQSKITYCNTHALTTFDPEAYREQLQREKRKKSASGICFFCYSTVLSGLFFPSLLV